MTFDTAALWRACTDTAAAAFDYNRIHAEGRAKGIDLPYEDEMTQALSDLAGKPGKLVDAAETIYGWSEKDRLKHIRRELNVTAPADDYYDLLAQGLAGKILAAEVVRLRAEAARLTRLLK